MSSPSETVDQLFGWLEQTLGVTLPRLPLQWFASRLTALFRMIVPGPLPQASDPLPWIIPIEGKWTDPVPGTSLSIDGLSVQVKARHPASLQTQLAPSTSASPKENAHGH